MRYIFVGCWIGAISYGGDSIDDGDYEYLDTRQTSTWFWVNGDTFDESVIDDANNVGVRAHAAYGGNGGRGEEDRLDLKSLSQVRPASALSATR